MLERYYHELIGYFARALRDREAAADVVHESYARVLAQHGAAVAWLAEPRALLYRTGKNLVVDDARRRKVEASALASWAVLMPEQAPSAERELQARQHLQRLAARLKAMPRKRREVFVLVRVHGCTHAEVCEHLGLTPAAVEQHVVRAVLDCAVLAAEWRA